MIDLTNLINSIVRKRMENISVSDEYDVVDVALLEDSFRTTVKEVLDIANEMGFLGISDYLEGFEEGIKAEKERNKNAREKLDNVWEAVKDSEDTDFKTQLLAILES